MKQPIRFTLFSLFVACLLISACGNQPKTEPTYTPVHLPQDKAPAQKGKYCPMHCEGDKVYPDSVEKCPVCEMKLVSSK